MISRLLTWRRFWPGTSSSSFSFINGISLTVVLLPAERTVARPRMPFWKTQSWWAALRFWPRAKR